MTDWRISGSKATVKLKIKVDSVFGFSLIIWILQRKNRLAVNRGFIETWCSPQWTAAVRQVPTVILQNLTEHPKSKYHKGSFQIFHFRVEKRVEASKLIEVQAIDMTVYSKSNCIFERYSLSSLKEHAF